MDRFEPPTQWLICGLARFSLSVRQFDNDFCRPKLSPATEQSLALPTELHTSNTHYCVLKFLRLMDSSSSARFCFQLHLESIGGRLSGSQCHLKIFPSACENKTLLEYENTHCRSDLLTESNRFLHHDAYRPRPSSYYGLVCILIFKQTLFKSAHDEESNLNGWTTVNRNWTWLETTRVHIWTEL